MHQTEPATWYDEITGSGRTNREPRPIRPAILSTATAIDAALTWWQQPITTSRAAFAALTTCSIAIGAAATIAAIGGIR